MRAGESHAGGPVSFPDLSNPNIEFTLKKKVLLRERCMKKTWLVHLQNSETPCSWEIQPVWRKTFLYWWANAHEYASICQPLGEDWSSHLQVSTLLSYFSMNCFFCRFACCPEDQPCSDRCPQAWLLAPKIRLPKQRINGSLCRVFQPWAHLKWQQKLQPSLSIAEIKASNKNNGLNQWLC